MAKTTTLMSDSMIKLLNYRIQEEEQSARIYLAMTMWLWDKGYLGAAKLFKKYSDEEYDHADKARDMLLAHGIQPKTPSLAAPKDSFKSFPEVIKLGHTHEQEITRQCQDLAAAAQKEQNYMVLELALWYCKEQVEELDKFQNFLDRLDAFGTEPDVLRLLDAEMGEMAGS